MSVMSKMVFNCSLLEWPFGEYDAKASVCHFSGYTLIPLRIIRGAIKIHGDHNDANNKRNNDRHDDDNENDVDDNDVDNDITMIEEE